MTDTLTSQGEASAPTYLCGSFLPENSKLFWLVIRTVALAVMTLASSDFGPAHACADIFGRRLCRREIPLNIPARGWRNSWAF